NYTVINPGGGVLEPFEFGTSQKVAGPVNTMDPFSNEPLLSRGAPIQEINCRIPPYSKTSRCYQYSGPVYINYTSDEIPEIEISVSLSGRNEWWELVGWTSNEYSDRILLTLKNGEKGWIQATGNLQTGNGYYY
ncbi:MAG TPA: hypothetical protein VMS89_04850, partial [Methanoregulaceae archaeon]|nr:hypothetical protein [Methanoregulaceae archaeon]